MIPATTLCRTQEACCSQRSLPLIPILLRWYSVAVGPTVAVGQPPVLEKKKVSYVVLTGDKYSVHE